MTTRINTGPSGTRKAFIFRPIDTILVEKGVNIAETVLLSGTDVFTTFKVPIHAIHVKYKADIMAWMTVRHGSYPGIAMTPAMLRPKKYMRMMTVTTKNASNQKLTQAMVFDGGSACDLDTNDDDGNDFFRLRHSSNPRMPVMTNAHADP